MKRLLVIPFLLFYLASVSGFALCAHYCCGSLESVHIACAKAPSRGKTQKDCCADFTHFFKVHDAGQVSLAEGTGIRLLPFSSYPAALDFSLPGALHDPVEVAVHPPPLAFSVPRYLFHRNLVI